MKFPFFSDNSEMCQLISIICILPALLMLAARVETVPARTNASDPISVDQGR